jgi:hypothetical protein
MILQRSHIFLTDARTFMSRCHLLLRGRRAAR